VGFPQQDEKFTGTAFGRPAVGCKTALRLFLCPPEYPEPLFSSNKISFLLTPPSNNENQAF
jgi:hypothetical protein